MSALQASRKFGVPSRTLYDKVKKMGITTGRPMNRGMKRSPSNVESSPGFPYVHSFGQAAAASGMHESIGVRDDMELKEHHRNNEHSHHTHMQPTIPHPAAALLDRAFLQQAFENHGGDIAGREALHAMALAAAAHAAVNRNNGSVVRSPSPNSFAMKYGNMRLDVKQEMMEREQREIEMAREREYHMDRERELEHEQEQEREHEREHEHEHEHEHERELERNEEREHDHVEDLSVARKISGSSPIVDTHERLESPYGSPDVTPLNEDKSANMHTKLPNSEDFLPENVAMKREVIIDDNRAD